MDIIPIFSLNLITIFKNKGSQKGNRMAISYKYWLRTYSI